MDDSNSHLSLRKAIKTDEVFLFNWVNDPDVRKWSFNEDPISLNEHKLWFKKKLNDSNALIWIFEDHNSPAGMVRLEKKDNEVLVNYLIASQSRGKKLASKMLKLAMNEVRNYWQNTKIFAYTLPGNIASIQSLERAGFSLDRSSDEKNRYIFINNDKIDSTGE